ncbi:oligosaccharide flippase family protein [Bacillus sp. CGMCC 1.16607]|uniref:putative polysaccharide biosynthesis protein n=1 Tax=Bacillus sp. CGMCC 1.16607 TaxID=3351842 RepID=UPI0036355580
MLCYNTLEFHYRKELGFTRGSNEWFKGAFILTLGALMTKILSAIYRVPFQNIVGDIGFYIYQQVYPFLGLALILSTYGFPVIISKQLMEFKVKQQSEKIFRFLTLSLFVLNVLGIFAFLCLYYGSTWLALQMKDPNLSILLKVISVVFLIFPTISVLRGYFQGMGNMIPTAVSQVGEQLFRVVTILTVAVLMTKEGLSLYVVGGGASSGSIIGGLTAIFILIIFFLKEVRQTSKSFCLFDHKLLSDLGKVTKLLLLQGFAVCISGMFLIFMQLADSLNMLSLMVNGNIELDLAKELKGIYDRGQPLIQLGSVVATSMSLSLVPLISSERVKENKEILLEKIRFALQISLVIGTAATVGLLAIVHPTNEMLFKNQEGSTVLAVLTVVIMVSSVTLTVISILQGLEVMFFPAWVILFSFGLKLGLNIVFIPKLGPVGAAIATNISIAVGLVLLWWKLKRVMNNPLLSSSFIIKVAMASFIMFLFLKAYLFATNPIYGLVESHRLVAAFQAMSGVTIGGFIYLLVMMRMNIFRIEDLALLPFGSKLIYLLPKEKGSRNHEK